MVTSEAIKAFPVLPTQAYFGYPRCIMYTYTHIHIWVAKGRSTSGNDATGCGIWWHMGCIWFGVVFKVASKGSLKNNNYLMEGSMGTGTDSRVPYVGFLYR